MKLKVIDPPKEYTSDRCVTLINMETDQLLAIAYDGGAYGAGKEIARAVNYHAPMLDALTVFSSAEMGGLLCEMIEVGGLPADGVAKFQRLVKAIDAMLKSLEPQVRLQ